MADMASAFSAARSARSSPGDIFGIRDHQGSEWVIRLWQLIGRIAPARSGAAQGDPPAPCPPVEFDPGGTETVTNAHSWMMRLLYVIRVTLSTKTFFCV